MHTRERDLLTSVDIALQRNQIININLSLRAAASSATLTMKQKKKRDEFVNCRTGDNLI